MEPNRPIPTGRDLISLEIEKLIARHIIGEDKGALSLEHRREDDAVKDDIVLTDEVDHAGLGIFPPGLPTIGEELFGIGDIADRGVKPYVEHLALSAL